MFNNLHIEELRNEFAHQREIVFEDIDEFYRSFTPDIPIATVRWRIHALLEKRVLYSIGRGVYRLGTKEAFSPVIHQKTKRIGCMMRDKFPFVDYCQWDLAAVNAFAQHMINTQIYFVDVERDATESVYYAIRDLYPRSTVLYRNLDDDLSYYDGYVVVRNLVSGAPVRDDADWGFPMATLEKILVDWALDRMFPFQNTEILRIYENALATCAVSTSKMLRYAGRRGRHKVIEDLLDEIDY